MAFALGEAIAEEFRRIAELLALRNLGSPSPTPGGGGTSPSPPGGSGTGGHPPSPSPPGTGQPPAPITPPRIVTVPWGNVFPAPAPQAQQCPLFAPTDYHTLLTMERQAREQGTTVIPPYILPGGNDVPIGSIFGSGIPVESTDFFRFRTYGTAPATAVSFFGRVERSDRVIIPFNHTLTTDTASTVFQTLPATGAGILLGAAASVPLNSITSGAVFAVGEIGRIAGGTFTPHTLLFSGQLNDKQPLSSTLASPTTPVSNPTFFRPLLAGGAVQTLDMTITPTAGKRARVTFFDVALTTVAGGTARGIATSLRTGGTAKWYSGPALLLAASSFVDYTGAIGGPDGQQTPAGGGLTYPWVIPLPESLYFTEAFIVRIQIQNGSASDRIENLFVGYEET